MLFLLCFAERVGVEMIKGCQEFLLTGFLAVQMERGSKVSPQDKKKIKIPRDSMNFYFVMQSAHPDRPSSTSDCFKTHLK